MWRFYLYFVKITTPKSIISTGWETINHLVRAPDTWHVWPMDNDGSLIVCQLLFTFQISFNSSPSRPHPWREPVICAARTGWGKECLELMIPIIRQKPLFIHHFGSCDPAWPTQASVNTRERWNLHDLTFLLTQSDEWWRDIQILFVTRGEGWVCQDCDRSLITGDKLCLHWGVITGVIMQTCGDLQEALILSRYSWMLTPPHGWWSGDRHCNLIRYCPESVPVITHPPASPHQFYVSVWSRCWEITRHEEWERGVRRGEVWDHLGEMPSLMTQRWDLSEHNG